MPKYAVAMKQGDEGCGHTIGCALKMVELNSSTHDEALVEARALVVGIPDDDYPSGYEGGYLLDPENQRLQLVYARLVQIDEDLPILQWHAEMLESRRQRQEEDQDLKERAEYMRLKKKYG